MKIWQKLLVVALLLGSAGPASAGLVQTLLEQVQKPFRASATMLARLIHREDESRPEYQVIGSVRVSHQGYALIFSNREDLPEGLMLTTLDRDGEPQDTRLRLRTEREAQFLVSDVVEGEPKAGHLVVLLD